MCPHFRSVELSVYVVVGKLSNFAENTRPGVSMVALDRIRLEITKDEPFELAVPCRPYSGSSGECVILMCAMRQPTGRATPSPLCKD